ncbi:MAG TPA: hypothetical protein VN920_08125 [Pyrinomonadaceae bacterium]|nr:hypothetical protein [Pyrinomonadaceae bacterium]
MFSMAAGERDEIILTLQQKLRELEARFDAEARRRGFDPAQAENMALPSTLARLFAECQELRSELAEITGNK